MTEGKKIKISDDCYIKVGKDDIGQDAVAIYTFGEKRCTLKPETLKDIFQNLEHGGKVRKKLAAAKA